MQGGARIALQTAVALMGVATAVALAPLAGELLGGERTKSEETESPELPLGERIAAARRELAQLRVELGRVEDARTQSLIDAVRERERGYDPSALVGRLKARDAAVLRALEDAARSATTSEEAAQLYGMLFVGTGDPRKLEQAFEARALPGGTASWAERILELKLDDGLSDAQSIRVLTQVEALAGSDRQSALDLLEQLYIEETSREEFTDPAVHDRLVALARECLLAGRIPCLGALARLSEEAALAAAATLLAEPDRPVEFRGKLLGALYANRTMIDDEDLLEGLPEGETPADWQAWLAKNREVVDRGMAIGR
jgi:hypothetical protein